MRRHLLLAALPLATLAFAAPARAADVPRAIPANINDAGIETARGDNLIWLPAAGHRADKLLVFLPFGGALNIPREFEEFGTQGGRLGYHTIVLAYKNEVPIAAATGCGNDEAPPLSPPNCAINARMEILDGNGESPVIDVNRANSIENRLNKVLVHLATAYPTEGWDKFLDASGAAPKWSEVVIAGGSLGAGQAAIIATQHVVPRVALISGWTDAMHGWVLPGVTPTSRYFALIHARENFYGRTCSAYVKLGLPSCPADVTTVEGKARLVENLPLPFGTPLLVTDVEPPIPAVPVTDRFLPSTIRDGYIPTETDGTPSLKLLNAWRSILGDADADTYLDDRDNCKSIANADQTDSDKNGVGDACGPTFATGTLGGSVPGTLALTLGPAATFGPFTPGVDRTYNASTTASVITTAGDAALTVSDPGRLANGTFTLPEPLQVAFSKSTWFAPASNDPVTITFKQLIKGTDALRTGTYSKTLTFTLSTTTP